MECVFVAFLGQASERGNRRSALLVWMKLLLLSFFLVAGFLHSPRELHFYLSRTFLTTVATAATVKTTVEQQWHA